jgi:catechol 2,3-dioxygenase-like lactoylglutathione lyase family enzyme
MVGRVRGMSLPVVIVTGPAHHTARALAGCGYAVVIVYLQGREADGVVAEIERTGGAALAIRADLDDELDVERMFDETLAVFGRVDAIIQGFDPGIPGRERPLAWATVRQTPTDGGTMSTADLQTPGATTPARTTADFKLEVVVLPVSDVDRARAFYERLGWRLDADLSPGGDFRVVQLTPPGSPTSVIFGSGVTDAAPGAADSLVLVVDDIERARAELVDRGVDVSEVFHDATGIFHHAGTKDRVPGPDPSRSSYGSWASFSDPDGNGWLLQEITTRLPGR